MSLFDSKLIKHLRSTSTYGEIFRKILTVEAEIFDLKPGDILIESHIMILCAHSAYLKLRLASTDGPLTAAASRTAFHSLPSFIQYSAVSHH